MTATFAKRHKEIGRMTRKWRVGPAYIAARQLVRDFPGEADGYTLFNLLICLTNNGGGKFGGLRKASPRLIDDAMMTIPDFAGSVAHGDMLRDLTLGLVRFPVGDNLRMANRLLKQIRQIHANDDNRLACLMDAEARLAAAEGSTDYAYGLHGAAHQKWTLLGDAANPSWVYFNLVHWLRVSIKLYGRKDYRTQEILRHLHGDKPSGAHSDRQIQVICLPIVGLRAYRWLETHRM